MRTTTRWVTMGRMSRTVLIVDDHGPYRVAARAMLEADGFTVVGEAGTGSEALAKADALRPAIVLLDVQLPDQDGFAVAERIAEWEDPPAVVLISSRSARTYETRLPGARALGFIPKSQLTGPAIEALLLG
jgi:DNA-binding NarL/FixJ family response regulator